MTGKTIKFLEKLLDVFSYTLGRLLKLVSLFIILFTFSFGVMYLWNTILVPMGLVKISMLTSMAICLFYLFLVILNDRIRFYSAIQLLGYQQRAAFTMMAPSVEETEDEHADEG